MASTNTTPAQTQQRVISKRAEQKGRSEVAKNFSKLERLTVEYAPAEDFIPNPWNPNRQSDHDFQLLCRSMEEDGFTQPIIVIPNPAPDGPPWMVVDGEHRWRAGQVVGVAEIPYVPTDMTPEQSRISTVRHNRARGSHDIELEASLLRDLQALGAIDVAQDSLMLDDEELNRMLTDIAAPEALADEDYSEAWVPDSFTEEEAELVREGVKGVEIQEYDDGRVITGMTAEAVEDMRRREGLIAAAKSERDRILIRKESKVFRLSLVFTGEQAKLVKRVLGQAPAEMLLALCRRYEDPSK